MKILKEKNGFTLMELLMVVAITTIVTASFTFIQSNSISGTYLKTSASQIIQEIRLAQTRAATRYKDSAWGVYFTADQYIMFKGNTYIARDPSEDHINGLNNSLSIGGISLNGVTDYIAFEKSTGETSNYGSLQISNGNRTIRISINQKGLIEQNEI